MQCSICLNDIDHECGSSKTSCDHHFHKNCLEEWFNNLRNISDDKSLTCPICRHDLTDDQPKFYYWEGTRELKMFRTKDCEVRYYPCNSIKYRIFFNENNEITSGTIFNKDGTNHINIHDIDISAINLIRNRDYYEFNSM